MEKFVGAFTLLLILSGTHEAQAAPITWTISGLVFSDGGTGSGSFVYDADTQVYSSIAITTTAGSVLSGATYDVDAGISIGPSQIWTAETLPLDPGVALLNLAFGAPLTNAGGVVQVVSGIEGLCLPGGCFQIDPIRLIPNASEVTVTAPASETAVPEPASLLLLGTGAALLGAVRRRARVNRASARRP